jgi:hypothetical protein
VIDHGMASVHRLRTFGSELPKYGGPTLDFSSSNAPVLGPDGAQLSPFRTAVNNERIIRYAADEGIRRAKDSKMLNGSRATD